MNESEQEPESVYFNDEGLSLIHVYTTNPNQRLGIPPIWKPALFMATL